ncbi:hypothetical protein C1A50_0752 [Paenibacillus polymyxa]|nr:hypothetical protein C1A50_0752 [Paenibacillus polymyxa]
MKRAISNMKKGEQQTHRRPAVHPFLCKAAYMLLGAVLMLC